MVGNSRIFLSNWVLLSILHILNITRLEILDNIGNVGQMEKKLKNYVLFFLCILLVGCYDDGGVSPSGCLLLVCRCFFVIFLGWAVAELHSIIFSTRTAEPFEWSYHILPIAWTWPGGPGCSQRCRERSCIHSFRSPSWRGSTWGRYPSWWETGQHLGTGGRVRLLPSWTSPIERRLWRRTHVDGERWWCCARLRMLNPSNPHPHSNDEEISRIVKFVGSYKMSNMSWILLVNEYWSGTSSELFVSTSVVSKELQSELCIREYYFLTHCLASLNILIVKNFFVIPFLLTLFSFLTVLKLNRYPYPLR